MGYPKSLPWVGLGRPISDRAFTRAADKLGCDAAAIQAVWQTEASGRGFLADRSLIRRFEPHHMPGATTTWRDSLKLSPKAREQAFLFAYANSPDDALRATSWGGPQIMGFNCGDCAYATAEQMVRAMSDSEDQQLADFVVLVTTWKLDGAIRAHDWLTFAKRYNGNGQAADYAKKIEANYRKLSGRKSPVVLRSNDTGEAVKRLQTAVGIEPDGKFGPGTLDAVVAFQRTAGLPDDGVVGKRTWDALQVQAQGIAAPVPQPTQIDTAIETVTKIGSLVGVIGGMATALNEVVPASAQPVVYMMLAGAALIVVAAGAFRWARAR